MAVSGKDSKSKTYAVDFLEQAKYLLNKFYRQWTEIYNASPEDQKETICIPDALDVLPNRRFETHQNIADKYSPEENVNMIKETKDFDRKLLGQRGEDKFVSAFRKLKLGGLLICGINTSQFIKNIMNKKNCKKWKEHFECDALFLHHQLGAFVIETKACDDENVLNERVHDAAVQLEKRISGLEKLYRRIIHADCSFDFHGVICIPNSSVALLNNNYKVLGKMEVENAERFRLFWLPEGSMAMQRRILRERSRKPITDAVISFIAAMIGCRCVKFVSWTANVMEIYRIIDQHEFERARQDGNIVTSKCSENENMLSIRAESIILTKEQLRAVECPERHIIINGPPGTGKTIVMLLRALAAAKMNTSGRVVIVSGRGGREGESLKTLFQKFIADNRNDEFTRTVNLESGFFNFSEMTELFRAEDDIFIDEMTLSFGFRDFLTKQPEWRRTALGSTTIVITGNWFPEHIADEIMKARSIFPDFHNITLKTVIRGTLSIIDEWKCFLPDRLTTNGHNVKGCPIKRIYVNSHAEVLTTVEQMVSLLLNDTNEYLGIDIAPCHIAILASHRYSLEYVDERLIRRRLQDKGFSCGSIIEQIKNKNLIAVSYPTFALSFDWPVVIYVRRYDAPDSHDLIAMSRCISKLIIIEYNAV